uniref:Ubiquitin-like domain-containing protein n=1 Tax=Oryza meridionalis TaxID=40149 RepID=A0A0E0D6Y4_9ORYZ
MAHLGGGGRGGRGGEQQQRPPYSGRGDPGRSGGGPPPRGGIRPATGSVWPPPGMTPRPGPPPPEYPQPGPPAVVHGEPMPALHHQASYQPGAVYRAPSPGVPVPLGGYARSTPVTIRAPPPSHSSAPAPYQPAPAPASSSSSSAPSATALAKEVEQKLFVSETALAPPAGEASAAAAPAGEASVASDKDLAPVSKKGLAHPARPGYGAGAAGKKVMIRANQFLVNVADNNLFHYDASSPHPLSLPFPPLDLQNIDNDGISFYKIVPDICCGTSCMVLPPFHNVSINPESKSRATNREVLNELIKVHGRTSPGVKLPAFNGRKSLYTNGSLPFESEEFVVKLIDPEKKDKERVEREYKITIRIAARADLYHLQQFLLVFQQFLLGRKRDMPQETIMLGRQRDMPQETILLGRQMDMPKETILDVVLKESPFWNYVTVSRFFFFTQFGHRGDIGDYPECWRDISATSFFKPVTVFQFAEEFLNIRDTSRPLSDRDRVKYFWDRYNYRLKYVSWPRLQSGSDSRPVYLPMEVCKIVEGQRYSKKLNDKQVTNILRATCQRPQQRERSIHEEFGIKVCNDLVSVPARVLPPPMKMINGGTVDSFSQMHPEEVQRFCGDLIQMCNATGMSCCPRPVVDIRLSNPNNIENALRDVHRRTKELLVKEGKGSLQLLNVILPEVSGSYGKIKRVCETDLGCVSQCCLPRHASRLNKQYLENVALNINVKVSINPESESRPTYSEVIDEFIKLHGKTSLAGKFTAYDGRNRRRNVLVRVDVCGLIFKRYVRFTDTVQSIVHRAMQELNCIIRDSYISFQSRPLKGHLSIRAAGVEDGSTIYVNHRLRGGSGRAQASNRAPASVPQPTGRTSLRAYITSLRTSGKWFEWVEIPSDLRTTRKPQSFVLYWAEDARRLLRLIFACLERSHARRKTFDGNFKLDDMFYNYDLDVVEIVAPERLNLVQSSYAADLKAILEEVINAHFRYRNASSLVYPAYGSQLKEIISSAPYGHATCYSIDSRSLIFNHISMMDASQRIAIITSCIIHQGTNANTFKGLLNKLPLPTNLQDIWTSEVSHNTNSGQALRDCYGF